MTIKPYFLQKPLKSLCFVRQAVVMAIRCCFALKRACKSMTSHRSVRFNGWFSAELKKGTPQNMIRSSPIIMKRRTYGKRLLHANWFHIGQAYAINLSRKWIHLDVFHAMKLFKTSSYLFYDTFQVCQVWLAKSCAFS